MLWLLLCGWHTAFVYLDFYSAEAHDPTISQWFILNITPLLFFNSSDKNKEDEWGKALKKNQTSCQQCTQKSVLICIKYSLERHQSASPPSIPTPCTQVNGFMDLTWTIPAYPSVGCVWTSCSSLGRAVEDKMLWSCPSRYTHPISGSKFQHSRCIFSHILLYLFPVTH